MSASKTVKIAVDGVKVPGLVRVDGNGEFAVYTKPDERNPQGRVFFFPGDCDLDAEIKRHNEANKETPVFAEDAAPAVDEELEAWLSSGTQGESAENGEEPPIST